MPIRALIALISEKQWNVHVIVEQRLYFIQCTHITFIKFKSCLLSLGFGVSSFEGALFVAEPADVDEQFPVAGSASGLEAVAARVTPVVAPVVAEEVVGCRELDDVKRVASE